MPVPSDPMSRRQLLRHGALATAALAASVLVPGCGDPAPARPTLRLAGYPFDRVRALVDGRVQIDGWDVRFEKAPIYELNAVAMGGDQRWDVSADGLPKRKVPRHDREHRPEGLERHVALVGLRLDDLVP